MLFLSGFYHDPESVGVQILLFQQGMRVHQIIDRLGNQNPPVELFIEPVKLFGTWLAFVERSVNRLLKLIGSWTA